MHAVSSFSTDLDLAACDREPIRIPGSVQQHGFLVALSGGDTVVQVSDNLAAFTGIAADAALGQPLDKLLGAGAAQAVLAELARTPARGPAYLGAIDIGAPGHVDVVAHASEGLTVLEFERAPRTATADFRLLHTMIGNFFSRLTDDDTIGTLGRHAIEEIKALTGFGRVLACRFDEVGNGHVFAELCDPGYERYLGHRFPAADIPCQAREFYLANRICLVPDARYRPARLVPEANPLTGRPTDLTHAVLRSVSPVHLQYMRSMGTLSSLSMSLVVQGRLWGLISCHHAQPRHVSFEKRAACEQLAQILALRIAAREEREEYTHRLELRRNLVAILGQLSRDPDIEASMQAVTPDLLRFGNATGAALVSRGRVATFGEAPADEQVLALVDWLAEQQGDSYHTDALGSVYPPASGWDGLAAGVLAVSLSRVNRHYLLWFRREVVQQVDWAGNAHPMAMQEGQDGTLAPRTGFHTWHEEVRGRSLPWRASDIDIALEFRSALLDIVLERAEAMAALADDLTRANKELEAFSYSVSHDLRAPLRHIVGYADLLLELDDAGDTNGRRGRFLRNIKDSARFAGKLVDDLLSFSRMGRASMHPSSVDMNALFRACIDKLSMEIGERSIEWRIDDLPAIDADPTFLQMAVSNLLSNAVKYTGPREHAVVEISATQDERETVFSVKDNGVGFNADYVHKLFGVFQRLHRMEEFQGTGIGLANVRRIVERHGGRVWAEGAVQQGATFHFAIPRQLQLD